ncbi:DUF2627 domain-containing protein [Ornithinibacillus gellani]|uniref:DUF2627 domain-containing protein n=1 Tax=Ornithinibacillus gellani TaxID=2293253 RepID=UPI000F49F7F9|nr:DUF2627 domain-containing protein [Ornithinibacillus gellani]TQS74500.1 DUF2627 domain-containing protein [Ornithinibacillus gellani]
MVRIIAFSLLLIPGIFAAIGIKLMRDSIFDQFHAIFIHTGIQFTVGLILFVGGLAFIGGFVVHRDRKRNLVQREKRQKQREISNGKEKV